MSILKVSFSNAQKGSSRPYFQPEFFSKSLILYVGQASPVHRFEMVQLSRNFMGPPGDLKTILTLTRFLHSDLHHHHHTSPIGLTDRQQHRHYQQLSRTDRLTDSSRLKTTDSRLTDSRQHHQHLTVTHEVLLSLSRLFCCRLSSLRVPETASRRCFDVSR